MIWNVSDLGKSNTPQVMDIILDVPISLDFTERFQNLLISKSFLKKKNVK